jgi:hypothetical protein
VLNDMIFSGWYTSRRCARDQIVRRHGDYLSDHGHDVARLVNVTFGAVLQLPAWRTGQSLWNVYHHATDITLSPPDIHHAVCFGYMCTHEFAMACGYTMRGDGSVDLWAFLAESSQRTPSAQIRHV